jgi:transketolase
MSLTEAKVSQLQEKAKLIRQSVVDMLIHAGSGHIAGSLDMADIFAYLYFYSIKHDPKNPAWQYRDRVVLSNGHICPVLYATLAHSGYFDLGKLKTLRRFGSELQGHPDRNFLNVLETSSGPLGSGLSQALGMALADRIDNAKTSGKKFICLMSDGELDEGNTWEAIMLAGKEKINSLIAIVDRNNIQISGNTDKVMPLEPLTNKWRAFNWQVIEIDGHNFVEIDRAVETAKMDSGKPTVIIAKTISSKGVPEFEGKYEWHGKAPSTKEEIEIVSKALGVSIESKDPNIEQSLNVASSDLHSMREAFGQALVTIANADNSIVALSADLSDSTGLGEFKKKFPDRYIEVGVAEQNLVTVASGLSANGKIPFVTSYAIFSPGRNWEQIRTTICYNNQPVKIVSTHVGLNVGADGGSHQALEDIALMRVLPNMTVLSPCDSIETKKAVLAMAKTKSPVYLRLSREKSPNITKEEDEFKIGKAQVVFETKENLSSLIKIKKDTKQSIGIIATGPILAKALSVAKKLDAEGKKVVVMNVSTIKPLDEDAVIKLAHKYGALVTCEEHQMNGGLGSAIAETLSAHFPVPIEFVAVKDKFGQSGKPDELLEHYGLGEKDIYKAVERVMLRKRSY